MPTTGILQVEWAELVWAAVTVGKWRDDLFSRGVHSSFEAAYRVNLLYAFLRDDGGQFIRSAAYDDLDPTEKSGVSYHLGMVVAKVLADRLLATPWLMHLDRYRRAYGVMLPPGNSRPDLFGPKDVDQLDKWVVLEAKGRTNRIRDYETQTLVRQKGRVLTVGKKVPWIRGGVASHFGTGVLEAVFVDPPPDPKDEPAEVFRDFHRDSGTFVSAYLEPIYALVADDRRPSAYSDVEPGRALLEADIAVGILPDSGRPAHERTAVREPRFVSARDGVTVRLGQSWSQESMSLEPSERESPSFGSG